MEPRVHTYNVRNDWERIPKYQLDYKGQPRLQTVCTQQFTSYYIHKYNLNLGEMVELHKWGHQEIILVKGGER